MGGITTQPLRPWGCLEKGTKADSGYINRTFSRPRSGWYYYLGGSQKKGTKSESGYITFASSGVPIVGQDQSGRITPAFSGFPEVGRHDKRQSGASSPCKNGAYPLSASPTPQPPDFGLY